MPQSIVYDVSKSALHESITCFKTCRDESCQPQKCKHAFRMKRRPSAKCLDIPVFQIEDEMCLGAMDHRSTDDDLICWEKT